MKDFIVIAHRGAPGYLPEHTLESVAMAHAMGADYIEMDVVMTQDGHLVVFHDLYLDAMTDVATRFPGRGREDGRHYLVDFTLDEIRTLKVHERSGDNGKPAFPGRFPLETALFRIPTMEQEVLLIEGLNRSTGREVGLYVEMKSPAWHEQEGLDLVEATIQALADLGYGSHEDKVILESFDMPALKRARNEFGTDLKIVQLIGENNWRESSTDYDYLKTLDGLTEVAGYADGIGPWLPQVVTGDPSDISEIVQFARELGLTVHAYTLRTDQLPPDAGSIDEVLEMIVSLSGLDGVFTDQPDRVVEYRDRVK